MGEGHVDWLCRHVAVPLSWMLPPCWKYVSSPSSLPSPWSALLPPVQRKDGGVSKGTTGAAAGRQQRLGAELLVKLDSFLQQFLEGAYDLLMGQVRCLLVVVVLLLLLRPPPLLLLAPPLLSVRTSSLSSSPHPPLPPGRCSRRCSRG